MFRTLPLFKKISSNITFSHAHISEILHLKPAEVLVHKVVVDDKEPYTKDSIVYDYAQTSPSLNDDNSSYSTSNKAILERMEYE